MRLARFQMFADRVTPARLLLVAGLFHIALAVSVFTLGRAHVLPGTFDQNGNAISVAPDTVGFHDGAVGLAEMLGHGDFARWAAEHQPFHVNVYSICFLLFGRLVGENILTAEPINVGCYLAVLTLVFALGRDAVNRRVGLLAAIIVALWPSFLLHTTQLLRDQFFIIGMLALLVITQRWLTRDHTWTEALLAGGTGGLLAMFIWLARDNLALVMVATAIIGATLVFVRQVRERRILTANVAGMVLMLLLTITATQIFPRYRNPEKSRKQAIIEPITQRMSVTPWGRVAAYITALRIRFILTYPDAGSNIDSDLQFNRTRDVLFYLPRAAEIGFFAPFPKMWFTPGKQVGSAGRLLMGIETLFIYLAEALALYGFWKGRGRYSFWLLFLVSTLGMIALGLVVVNVGALYRIRYLFMLMIIILAVYGALEIFDCLCRRTPNNLSASGR